MIRVLALRHAPTEWNREHRLQGRTDVPLGEEGRRIAAAWRLPETARGWPCRSSPLARTRETAEAMGLAPVADPAFVEMDWGGFEGRTLEELRSDLGPALAEDEARGLDFRPAGGESPREVGARALAGLRRLREDSVIVTHKGVIRALFALALSWDMRSKSPVRLLPASAQLFALDGESLSLLDAGLPLEPPLRDLQI